MIVKNAATMIKSILKSSIIKKLKALPANDTGHDAQRNQHVVQQCDDRGQTVRQLLEAEPNVGDDEDQADQQGSHSLLLHITGTRWPMLLSDSQLAHALNCS